MKAKLIMYCDIYIIKHELRINVIVLIYVRIIWTKHILYYITFFSFIFPLQHYQQIKFNYKKRNL